MSKPDIQFPGTFEKGRFIPTDAAAISAYLATLKGDGIVIYKRKVKPRSNQQNRAWWGIVIPIFQACYGERNPESAHYTLLHQIHYDVVEDIKGRKRRVVKPTHNLPTDEFSELYKAAQQFMAEEYNCDVPDPDSNMARI
jgi:hypothetical protein